MTNIVENNIRLVSFDLWGTLIMNNPDFRKERVSIFADALGYKGNIELLEQISKEADDELDKVSEKTGKDADFRDRVKLIIKLLGKNQNDYDDNFFVDLRNKVVDKFTHLLPQLIEEDSLEIIKKIKQTGVNIALISNTGFIDGKGMRIVLNSLGILDLFDYVLFSNEVGIAKPHQDIYKKLIEEAGLEPQEILHIGDNLDADFIGAWKIGISAVLFDPADKNAKKVNSIRSIREILDIIEKGKKMHYMNYALYSLIMKDGRLSSVDERKFNAEEYSKFKYGDGEVGMYYGHQLASDFINKFNNIFTTDDKETDVVVTTSPYKGIVKGSSSIVRGFKNYLNKYLLNINKKPAVDITILKSEMFEGDYGTFSNEERVKIMNKNELFVMEEFIENKRLIVIDDVRITGSHEKNLINFFSSKNIKEIFFLYVATMDPKYAEKNPQIESEMNNSWVDNFDKLEHLMKKEAFILNARVCKYILSNKDLGKINKLMRKISDNVLYNLYNGIIADEYAVMPSYTESFKVIESEMMKRELLKDNNFISAKKPFKIRLF